MIVQNIYNRKQKNWRINVTWTEGTKKFQTYISLWTERILGDYATECYDEVGRESSLSRGEQMMKCVGTGELCSLLRHGEQNALAGDQYCGHTATHLGPVRSPQHAAREKRRIAQHVSCIGFYTHFIYFEHHFTCRKLHAPVIHSGNHIACAIWRNVQKLNIKTSGSKY